MFARVYFVFLFGWAILHAIFGDRWSWLFLLNSFAPYLFAPAPLVFVIALTVRQRHVWIGFGAAVTLAMWMFGGFFLPKLTPSNSNGATLDMMTYNMLYVSENTSSVTTIIRNANPDVVAIQELTPPAAEAIRRDLGNAYPFQILDLQDGKSGMGVISRYPLHDTGESLPGEWSNAPQVLTLEWNGTNVTLLHIHAISPNFLPNKMWATIRERERQARTIVEFKDVRPVPIVVLGDFNAGEQSEAYHILSQGLTDSWREAGWGLGHTFPGILIDSLPRAIHDGLAVAGWESPTLARVNTGITVPLWLIRIDYIFHSHHWQAVSARIGSWDGYSDHRPVIAKLVLTQDAK